MMFFTCFVLLIGCNAHKDNEDTSLQEDTSKIEDTEGSGMGTLSFQFAMDTDYMDAMDEPAEGNFYGAIYLAEDVGSIGPVDGAESLASLDVENIILPTDGSSTEILITIPDLPATEIFALGFLDSDGNADPENPLPDGKDPVTLPSDNDFDVIEDEDTPVRVYFAFLNPS
jgi:hypothetical protein